MALINTDWEKELDQVEHKVVSLLDDKVEPILDRMIAKASTEISAVASQSTYELQDVANNLLNELRVQRGEMVTEIKSLIRYTALMAFLVVVASVAVITAARFI